MTKTMLYKHPGPHKIHGGEFDYIITEDVEAAQKDGWCLTTTEALDGPEKAPTREEMEAKAKELGLKYNSRLGDKNLQKLIEDAIDELD